MDKFVVCAHSEIMPAAPPILAETSPPAWPDGLDASVTVFYLALLFGIPLLGYVFMIVDFRRYLRSLRRALVVVSRAVPVAPYWSLLQRPACLRAFGLELPCTEEDVLAAYREQAKTTHPDLGGDLQQFLQLQKHLEQALALVRSEQGP
jgi:cytochrome b561